jgi:L-seryl-tRNA(Ser) seleniumtransferase
MSAGAIRERATRLTARLSSSAGWAVRLVEGVSAVGGGSAPGVDLPTWLISLERQGLTASALESRLRQLTPPIVARVQEDRVVLDLRTVLPDDDEPIGSCLVAFDDR